MAPPSLSLSLFPLFSYFSFLFLSSSSNITQVNTSKLLQVTTTKRIATSTTYFLVKTHNSVQQANSINKINMQTVESSSLRHINSSRRKSKAQGLNRQVAKKDKEQLTT